MYRDIVLCCLILCAVTSQARTKVINQKSWSQSAYFAQTIGLKGYDMTFPAYGIDSVSHEWFDLCFHLSDPAEYLDKQSDYVNYFGQTGGTWSDGDNMLFSMQGNSYRMNRIYKDGFRIDSRFAPGVTFYKPNLLYHNMQLNPNRSTLNFETVIDNDADFVSVTGDMSGLFGGPDPGAFGQNSGGYTPYPGDRSYVVGGGQAEFQYNIEDRKTVRYFRTFRHHAYVDAGWRAIAGLNNDGDVEQKHAYHWRAQADGEIPLKGKMEKIERRDMVRMYYLVNALHRTSGQEYGFNPDELYQMEYYTASVYFRSPEWDVNKYRLYGRRRPLWSMGLTYGIGRVNNNRSVVRNIFDFDGMGFEPWTPHGLTHELTYAINLQHDLTTWLKLHFDGFNSGIVKHALNKTSYKSDVITLPSELESPAVYDIKWEPGTMFGGLLENTLGLEAHYKVSKKFSFRVIADATADGFILPDKKSIFRVNWQAEAAIDWRPLRILKIGLVVGNYRIPFTTDDMRFFANRYNSATIFQRNGDVFSTTGGKWHTAGTRLRQPQYFVIDLPIKIASDRHEITFHTTYKKFYNLWTVDYAEDPAEYGFFSNGIFFENPGEKHFVVNHRPVQGNNIVTNTPFFISNIIKYAYHGNYFQFSASWQTTIYNSATMGNGFWANDILTLTELTANPNYKIVANDDSHYATTHQIMPLGTARVMMGINTTHWRLGLLFKYINGQPLTTYKLAYELELEKVTSYAANAGGGSLTNLFGGRWTDPVFDIDFNVTYRGVAAWGRLYEIQFVGYNLYDFASRLAGNAFESEVPQYLYTRPRGVTMKLKFEL